MPESWKQLEITDYAKFSINPLRKLKFAQKVEPNPSKTPITLQLGDPSVFGNFPPARETVDAFKRAINLDSFLYNPGPGRIEARRAVAEYSRQRGPIDPDDVILSSGCNHALEMCMLTLAAPGENILVPRPCFCYPSLTDGLNIETKAYNLDPDNDWNIDLKHLESQIDTKTRAILVNTPGNPCGNVFGKQHILDLLALAERHKLPIIADEIYEFMVFPGVKSTLR